jgi:hypothetical protein
VHGPQELNTGAATMVRRFLAAVTILAFSILAFPTPVQADPVTEFVVSHLAGKVIDEVWE